MADGTYVGPHDTMDGLQYDPAETERLEGEYWDAFAETSPNGTYTICCIDECDTVTLFADDVLVFEKSLVGPYDMAVANNGTAIVSGFSEGGYQDGEHMLFVWDNQGTELFTDELRSTTDSVHINRTGEYGAIHTEQVLKQFDDNTPWDFSVYILDIGAGTLRTRYTEQIPGIEAPGPRRKQIKRINFIDTADIIYIALCGRGTPTLETDIWDLQEVPEDITVIDLDGNILQKGIPHIDRYPDHYELSDDAEERLGIADTTEDSPSDNSAPSEKGGRRSGTEGEDSGKSETNAELRGHIDRIQSWSPSDQAGIDSDIESSIDTLDDILDEKSPPLKQYPDISPTLFELTIDTVGLDPRQKTDPSRLFEKWYSQYPHATVEPAAVERALDRLEAMGPEVADLTEQYNNLPDADYIEVTPKADQVQEDLDEFYYGAQALGRIISPCVSEHGTVVVSFVSTGLTYLKTWAEEEDPDSYDGPSGNAGLRKASASILRALANHNSPGLAEELYDNRQALYDLCPAPSDASTTTPGNESKLIAVTILRLMVPLSDEYPDALEPILPSLIDNVGREYVFEALRNVAQDQPVQLVESFDTLDDAIKRGRDFEPATGEVDYPDVVSRLLQNAASEAPEKVWIAIDDWLQTEQQPEPRVTRAMLDAVAGELNDDSVLQEKQDALQTLVKHSDWQIRRIAVDLLRDADDTELEALLEDLASDPIPEVSDAAQEAIGDRGRH